uniref:Transposase n=1 Tax=Steinernema glaseri TaxID=37863 RepID=A0A1I7YJ77_9BILA
MTYWKQICWDSPQLHWKCKRKKRFERMTFSQLAMARQEITKSLPVLYVISLREFLSCKSIVAAQSSVRKSTFQKRYQERVERRSMENAVTCLSIRLSAAVARFVIIERSQPTMSFQDVTKPLSDSMPRITGFLAPFAVSAVTR